MNMAAYAQKPTAKREPMNPTIDLNGIKSSGVMSMPCMKSMRYNGGATVNSL